MLAINLIFSLKAKPPVSVKALYVSPKSLRLIVPVISNPAFKFP